MDHAPWFESRGKNYRLRLSQIGRFNSTRKGATVKHTIFALLCFFACGVVSAQGVQLKIMSDSGRIYFQLINWTNQGVRVNKSFVIGAEGQMMLNIFDTHGGPIQLSPTIDAPMPASGDYETIDPYLSIGRAYDLDFIKQ